MWWGVCNFDLCHASQKFRVDRKNSEWKFEKSNEWEPGGEEEKIKIERGGQFKAMSFHQSQWCSIMRWFSCLRVSPIEQYFGQGG